MKQSRELGRWRAHGELFKFSAEDMRAAGCHVGSPRRTSRGLVCEPTMDEMLALGLIPYDVVDAGYNLLCNGGINRMESLLIGTGGQAYDATHTAIAVGDGNGSVPTPAASDTDLTALTGASHRYIQPADATYPSQATQIVTIQATIATGNGNFEWREWAVSQDTAGSTAAATTPLLNHKGVDLGLKTNASSWAFKITITIS